jgi:hypothetical protein
MADNWPLPQLNEDFGEKKLIQQDGASPHSHNTAT